MVRFPVTFRSTCSLALTVLAGCSQIDAPALPQTLPGQWQQQVAQPASAAPTVDLHGWWKSFNDPVLDKLVARAVSDNLTLAQASSRLKQAHALTRQTDANYLPQLSLATRSSEEVSATDTFFQISLDAVWDLGLFGAREGAEKQAKARIKQAKAEQQAAQVTVVSEVVRQYLELRAAQQQIQTLEALAALDHKALALLDIRIPSHLASPDQHLQLQAQRAETLARLAQPRQVQARTLQSLAALLGQTSPDASWNTVQPLPRIKQVSVQQVPSDLLRTRPDIQRAEADVLQAAGELGLAHANLYPHVALGTSYLYAYNMTMHEKVRSNSVPMVGPIIDLPIFNWGQRKAAEKAQKYAMKAALQGYRQVLLDSVAQTEAALAAFSQEQERVEHLQQAEAALDKRAQHGLTLTQLGLTSQWEQLDAQRDQLQASLQLTTAQARRSLAFVALYKALGGAPLPAGAGEKHT
ncbi:efflux transporter outer membrane subunit [Pseudomonas luteola]|uniref:efflux transporter outer membrane subunit n=1 Tax=Pseudomonas luteola TaxID=47886 RepID=UPI003DA06BAA